MSAKYYKALGPDRRPYHGGSGQWPEPGEWLEVEGELKPCERGLHVCREDQLIHWLGPEIWEVEIDESELIDAGDKCVVRRARLLRRMEGWTEGTARLFAADCAERALGNFEARYPNDKHPRQAIQAARDYAEGRIDEDQLAAAWDAAWDAAGAAAGAAERTWQTERLMSYLNGEKP